MRTIILAAAAAAMVGTAAAHADDVVKKKNYGTAVGAGTGAAAGAVVGGPVGAVVGGIAGAVLGNATAVPEGARTYVVEHPVRSVAIEGQLSENYEFPRTVRLHPIPNYPDYAYVYVDKRPVVVRTTNRRIVYAPAADTGSTASISTEVPDRVVTYVRHHKVHPVAIEGGVAMGATVPDTVDIAPIPDYPTYGYVYSDNGPIIVERDTRRVIWTR
jgi:hypothetical protein